MSPGAVTGARASGSLVARRGRAGRLHSHKSQTLNSLASRRLEGMGLLSCGLIVIVGAGLAGLTCARVLHERRESFMVLEAADGAGGRVRTTVTTSGFRLDRGFQVLFTAYPAVRRHLSLARLDLQRF